MSRHYELTISAEVEHEMAVAMEWYESIRVGLGREMLMCTEAGLDGIVRFPFQHQIRYRDLRICFISRFPYGIHYRVVESTIQVVAFFHMHRDPIRWPLD